MGWGSGWGLGRGWGLGLIRVRRLRHHAGVRGETAERLQKEEAAAPPHEERPPPLVRLPVATPRPHVVQVVFVPQRLERVVLEGFDSERVDSAMHLIELGQKHVNTNPGLSLAYRLLPPWMHGGDAAGQSAHAISRYAYRTA